VLADAVARLDGAALGAARWFAGKGAEVAAVELIAALRPDPAGASLAVIEVIDAHGGREAYALPALLDGAGALAEAPPGDPLWTALARAALEGVRIAGDGCTLRGQAGPAAAPAAGAERRLLGADQSNTTLVLGERLALKCYRRLAWGVHPEIELTGRLTAAGAPSVPAVCGAATIAVAGRGEAGLLLVQDYVAGTIDGWTLAERELDRVLAASAATGAAAWAPAVGAAVAALHLVLAADGATATPAQVAQWLAAADALAARAPELLPPAAAAELRAAAPRLRAARAGLADAPAPPLARIHGDLHLGQLLLRSGQVWIVDFEGEPARPVAERRARHTPLRDLATLLRSADHAAHWVRGRRAAAGEPADAVVMRDWIAATRAALLDGYAGELARRGAPFAVDARVVRALEADKAVDELLYAVRFLPSWLDVARAALQEFPYP
jgi:maltokinase